MKRRFKAFFPTVLLAGVVYLMLELCSCINISAVFGISRAFGLFSMVAPVTGVSGAGLLGLFCALVRRFLWHHSDAVSWVVRAAHVPTICATAYWSFSHAAIRILIPIVCMILFWLHPIGAQAWPYALYWFIPILVYIPSTKNNIFCTALGSTFVAHGVGSVITLYLMSALTPAQWLALIPVVAVERLICATVMFASYYGFTWLMRNIAYRSSFDTPSFHSGTQDERLEFCIKFNKNLPIHDL
jgi:hypothetical protein